MRTRILIAILCSLAGHILLFLLAPSLSPSPRYALAGIPANPETLQISLAQPPISQKQAPPPTETMSSTGDSNKRQTSNESVSSEISAGLEEIYFPVSQLDIKPIPESAIVIPYPEGSIGRGKVGAILFVYINKAGLVDHIQLTDSNLPPAFEQAAIETFKNVRMSPGIKEDRKVNSRLKIEVEFKEELD